MEVISSLSSIKRINTKFHLRKENIIELWLFAAFILFTIVIRSRYHLLFHTVTELYTCLVSFGLFFIALHTSSMNKIHFIVFLGIGYFFTGVIDAFHIFTYTGVSIIFPSGDQSTVVQFWTSARYMMSLTLLGSTLLIFNQTKSFKMYTTFFSFFFICILILSSILYFKVFPACYVIGKGLTPFKIVSEYIITAVIFLVALLYFRLRKNMDSRLFIYMECHLISTVISELLFTSFFSPYDWTNVWAHVLRMISYFFLYKAVIEIGLTRPYAVLYRKLDKIDTELYMTSRKLQQEQEQRKLMEDMLLRNNRCYELVINNSSDAIIVTSENRFIFANEKAACIFGADLPGDLIGLEFLHFVHPNERDDVRKSIDGLKTKTGEPAHYDYRIVSSSGKITDVEVFSHNLLFQGKLSDISILKDVSDKRQIRKLENNIRDNEKVLNDTKEYSKMLTEFFSNISHELKTPLNVILGAVQILALPYDNQLPADVEVRLNKNHRIIKQNCYRLLRLVNNLIDLSKFDSGYLKLNLSNQNIVNIVEEITLSVADYINNRGLEIIFDTDVEEKITAVDADKLERIILNLLSNAVKFTDRGGRIFVTMFDQEDRIAISVKDTGIGIPEDKLNNIFDRFNQVDKTLIRNREGSGIGLSLVRTLVEMHGGTVKVSSKENEGTEIVLEFPAKAIDEKENTIISAPSMVSVEKINIEFSDIYSFD